MDARENDFERRARVSEEALLRQTPIGKRPFGETWWWFLLVTAWMWFRLAELAVNLLKDRRVEGIHWFALAALVVMSLLFILARRSGPRKRALAHQRSPSIVQEGDQR